MDTPTNVRDNEDLLRDENLLYYTSLFIGSNDWQSGTGRPVLDVLAEINMRVDRLRAVSPPLGTTQVRPPFQPLSHTLRPINREVSPALPPGHLSPEVSPDETVIRQRGRRRLPVTWSPDIDLKSISFKSSDRTPPKIAPGHLSPQKNDVNLRSAPRKRLTFREERIPLSPEKIDFSDLSTPEKFKITSPIGSPTSKRPKIEKF